MNATRSAVTAVFGITVALWGCQTGPAALTAAPDSPRVHAHEHVENDRATTQHRFEDAAYWSSVFDDPKRDEWQKPERVTELLSLRPGQMVADIGAGTGYFNRHLAGAVGETGSVYAVDVEPNLIAFMRDRADQEKTPNVIPVLGSVDNPRLPAGALDLILLVDTYHHIDQRRAYFRRLASRLARGGRIVVIDFFKRELPVGPEPAHKLASSQVIAELEAAGFEPLKQDRVSLPYQYLLFFAAAGP